MNKGKKGALELSINTIIIIVIGVTLLTLGLVFVRNIFTQTSDLSAKAFEDANRELDALGGNVNEFLTVSPEIVRIKAGDVSGFSVLIKNIEENSFSGVVARVITSEVASSKGVRCEFLDTSTSKNLRSPLTSGSEERFNIRVRTSKSSIGA